MSLCMPKDALLRHLPDTTFIFVDLVEKMSIVMVRRWLRLLIRYLCHLVWIQALLRDIILLHGHVGYKLWILNR